MTISLVTWNGRHWLQRCLDSVAAQSLQDYELLIFDNGSTDGSLELLRAWVEEDGRSRLIASDANLGYAAAHNRNISAAKGDAILLLNQDAELDPAFLEASIAVLDARPDVGAVQGLVWRLDGPGQRSDVIDTTGLVMHRDRRVVSRDQLVRMTDPERCRSVPVWGADGPAPVYRRSALLAAREPRSGGGLEVLDEDFFAYKEDVDLAWRLQRLGWGAWFEPAARAWHARGGGDTGARGWRDVVAGNMANPPTVRALSWRNQRLMQLKNEEAGALLRDLPWVLSRELQSWAFMALVDPRRLSAVPALIRALPAARRKRRYLAAAVRRAHADRPPPRPLSNRIASRLRISVAGKVVVHARLFGWRATFERAKEKAMARVGLAHQTGVAGSPVAEVRPGAVRIELDRPRPDAMEGAPRAMVLGWAHSAVGVATVEIYLDGEFLSEAFLGRARPDVEVDRQHLSVDGIAGFSAIVSLADVEVGPHVLHVVARDRAGSVRARSRPFRRIDPVAGYERLRDRGLEDLRAELANEGRSTSAAHLLILDGDGLEDTLRSLAAQETARWTCALVTQPERQEAVTELMRSVISDASDRCSVISELSSGLPADVDADRLLGFLCAGDILAPPALAAFARAAADSDAELLYADHDVVDEQRRHGTPWFVPDWSPDRLLAQDYIRGAFMVRDGRGVRDELAALIDTEDCGWRYRLLLARAAGAEVVHVRYPVWAEPVTTTTERAQAEAVAVRSALARRGEDVTIQTEHLPSGPVRRVEWATLTQPLVSIIVPTTGRMDLVEGTLRLLSEQTDYPVVETIFIDNGRGANPDGIRRLEASGATVVKRHEPFNWSRLNNAGVEASRGELLLFLNDDMEAIEPGWMDDLVRQVQRPGIGAVGSMLLYPDGMIQHAGVLLVGHGGGAAHLFQGLDPEDDLYLDLHRLRRETSAVTGACLMVERATFDEVGGFDEELEVSGNDVDFCIRVAATGRRVLWTPHSRLIHHESRSRGSVPYVPDQTRLWDRWGSLLRAGDPYFNPNLDADRVDCDLDWGRLEH